MATLSQLQTWLTEAEEARHLLATGANVAEIWRDGRRITYSASTVDRLNTYIATLKNDIAAATATAEGRPVRRALGPFGYRG